MCYVILQHIWRLKCLTVIFIIKWWYKFVNLVLAKIWSSLFLAILTWLYNFSCHMNEFVNIFVSIEVSNKTRIIVSFRFCIGCFSPYNNKSYYFVFVKPTWHFQLSQTTIHLQEWHKKCKYIYVYICSFIKHLMYVGMANIF